MPSPLLGYNHNVRHRGKLFHIQTEDSGVTHAHIFTHLFADGGRIIATKKTSYAHWIGTDRYPSMVKKLMQAQHKAMFIALKDGLFDEDEAAGAAAFAQREIVIDEDVTSETPPRSSAPGLDVEALERAAAGLLAQAATQTPAEPPIASGGGRLEATPVADSNRSAALSSPSATARPGVAPNVPVVRASPAQGISAATSGVPAARGPSSQDAPAARGPSSQDAPATDAPSSQGVSAARSPSSQDAPATDAPSSEVLPAASGSQSAAARSRGRYATTQPASRRLRPTPKPTESLFGADILSEKSLDEVILSYLADELEDDGE
jgi:hypothetical protein